MYDKLKVVIGGTVIKFRSLFLLISIGLLILICILMPSLAILDNVTNTSETAMVNETTKEGGTAQEKLILESEELKEEWAYSIALQAYVWGYPLVSNFNRYARVENNTEMGTGMRIVDDTLPQAPLNHICFLSDYSTPEERAIVAPNADTLYGSGWLNLSTGPVILNIPDMGDRYWIIEMCDFYTDVFASPGTRRGSSPGEYLIVGPGWNGTVPDGIVEVIHSPTNRSYVLARVLMKGQSDRPAVLPLINQITVFPLSERETASRVIDYDKVPHVQLSIGKPQWVPDSAAYWIILQKAMNVTEPRENEEALIDQFNLILESNDPAVIRGRERALEEGKQIILTNSRLGNLGMRLENRWCAVMNGGKFGTDYLTRGAAAESFIYYNLAEDAIYYTQEFDSEGNNLTGNNSYLIHFNKTELPPNSPKAFWSLTAYDAEHFFEENSIDRYNIGTVTEGLEYNSDGSLDVYLQKEAPEGNESNWLPVPKDKFELVIRTYMPGPSAMNGTYSPPPVIKVALAHPAARRLSDNYLR